MARIAGWASPTVPAAAMLTPTETAILWGLHHPVWLIAIALSLIFLLQFSFSAVGKLLRQFIKLLGRSPFFLSHWLFNQKTLGEKSAQEQQISTILQRLVSLQEEQAVLVAELKKLLPNQD